MNAVSRLAAPLFVWWDITYRCNLRCRYCYSGSGKPAPDELTTAEALGIIDDLAANGVFYVFFLGGEPFLRPDFLDLLAHCKAVGMSSMLTTNGWFVDDAVARTVAGAGVSIARVSIDGATAETHDSIRGIRGSFDRAIAAVGHFRNAGVPRVGISPTISRLNYHEIDKLIAMAAAEGADEIRLNPVCQTGRATECGDELQDEQISHLRALIREAQDKLGDKLVVDAPEGLDDRKAENRRCGCGLGTPDMIGCGAGRTSMAISPTGDVYYCILHRKTVGNLRHQSVMRIWESSPALQSHRTYRAECDGCEAQPICSGTCPIVKDLPPSRRREIIERTHGCSFPLHKETV